MVAATCPTCGKVVPTDESARPPTFPFCSTRCRDVDLGRWFSEQYHVPVETGRVAREVEMTEQEMPIDDEA